MLLFAGAVQLFGNAVIARVFADRPRPRDLLFMVLPRLDYMRYVADVVIFSALIVLLVYGLLRKPDTVPGMIAIFAIFYAFRAVIMTLTPLANAHGDAPYFGLLPIVQHGAFPSGHTGAALLCVLLVDKRDVLLRWALVVAAVVEWAALLLSRSHYSIDIVGGLLLAYFVWREWTVGHLFDGWRNLTETSPCR
jgi:membrane-associated phospholipid phosphatase